MTPYHKQTVRTVANHSNEAGYSIQVKRDGRWTVYAPGDAVSEAEKREIETITEDAEQERDRR